MPTPTFLKLPNEKRSRIVERAIEEFSEHPYRQASLSRIVVRAGIAKGSLYQYFDDKLDLYEWLVTDELGRRGAPAQPAEPDPSTELFEGLRLRVLEALRFAQAKPRLARIIYTLHEPSGDDDAGPLHARLRERRYIEMLELLSDARSRGKLHPDVDLSVAAMLLASLLTRGVVESLLARARTDMKGLLAGKADVLTDADLEDLAASLTSFLRRGLGVVN